jgi:N-acetyl-anhydromuramyl-L-alanine amidase AmpD
VDRAAELTGLTPEELRTRNAANVRGGAALLAEAQRELGEPLSADPADWYGAVAAYAGADQLAAAQVFADDVYDVINSGATRTTGEGQRVTLTAEPVTPRTAAADGLGPRGQKRDPRVECPPTISCEWIPAPYQENRDADGNVTGYGNHDKADRPRSQEITYIVIHDTEGTWSRVLDLVQDPTYVSWQYSLRSSDGHIAQHVPSEDVAWHAGNWFVNARSIGLEHEGFLTQPDAWYTEAMYRTSARLVRYLARKHSIPLDRHHIIGHDNVPGILTANVPGMHTDPGPYWDWAHYFQLLGAPFHPEAGPGGGLVTINPDYESHLPQYTHCDRSEPQRQCEPHGSGAVRLHVAPDHDAELVRDYGTHPGRDGVSSIGVNDVGARASTGQQFAVAGRDGDWTAIWYHGQRAGFHNPADQPTAVDARGWVVTGKSDSDTIPVYGRAYPEAAAYPEGVPYQQVAPLVYDIPADQRYVVGQRTDSEYYFAREFDTANHQVVRGEKYYQVQIGHRIGFVRAADVELEWSAS